MQQACAALLLLAVCQLKALMLCSARLGYEWQDASIIKLCIVYTLKMLCCPCSHRKRELEGFFEADGPLTLAWFYQVRLACSPAVHICCGLSCTVPA